MYPKEMIQIVKKFHNTNNYTIREISKIFNISKSTIHRWVSSNELIIKKNDMYNDINKDKIIDEIKKEIQKNPFLIIEELTKIINKKYSTHISKSGIYVLMKQTNLVFKKVKKILCNNSEEIKKKQKIFKNNLKKIKMKDIICIDETGIHSNICYDYGWAIRGSQIK